MAATSDRTGRPAAFVLALLLLLALGSGCTGAGGAPRETTAAPSHAIVPAPVVIGHRGAAGYRPEHTLAGYELAVSQGADAIEPDLVMTRDGVLVDRHEPEISRTTDVADHPELAGLRRTRKVDGKPVSGWFAEDLTLAQLRTLRAKERIPDVRPANARYDGRYPVPTFDEVLDLRQRLSEDTGRTITVVPELKHPTTLRREGLDPEKALVAALHRHGLDGADAPVLVQCSEPTALQRLRTDLGYRGPSILLVGRGAPYDLASSGDTRTYADLVTPQGLAQVRAYASAIGPDKRLVRTVEGTGRLSAPSRLVADAHAAGLEVVPYTFRAENQFLPPQDRVGSDPAARGRAADEVTDFLRAGVDGLFCDQPDVCVAARKQFLATR